MPYYPSTYPDPNWWAGRIFVREAQRLMQLEDTANADFIQRTIFDNLLRGIRALLELPAEYPTEKATEQLRIALPTGLPWSDDKSPGVALAATREFFYRWYHDSRYSEYTYYSWEDRGWDAELISELIGLSVSETEILIHQGAFTDTQLEILNNVYEDEIEDVIFSDFEEYWEMEEYQLLSHFGGYGEFRGCRR